MSSILLSSPRRAQSETLRQRSPIPLGSHLLITTSDAVYAWDRHGIRNIFNSSNHGILTTAGSNDGRHVLAVADSHNVVLHDYRRGRDVS